MSTPQGMFLRKLKLEFLFAVLKFVKMFTKEMEIELTVSKP
jgi:hypothetical protein